MKTIFQSIFLLFFGAVCFSQPIPTDSLYLGQSPPNDTPKIFLRSASGRIAISNDGKEIYYRALGEGLKYFQYSNNKWSSPYILFANKYFAPTFSIDEKTLYFHRLGDKNYDTWCSSKNDTSWSIPFLFGNGLYYFQVTNCGNKYTGILNPKDGIGDFDICEYIDSTYKSLGIPLNTDKNDAEFFIAKDESFIVLGANEGGPGGRDLYISFKKSDKTWSKPKSLGVLINDGNFNKWGPYVTADNKYLFYAKATSPFNIYWVRFDKLLDSLK